jgi:hypothetical protein
MSVQFGYATLFAVSYPLAAMLAWVNNLIEMRLDAYQLCVYTTSNRLSRGRLMGDVHVAYSGHVCLQLQHAPESGLAPARGHRQLGVGIPNDQCNQCHDERMPGRIRWKPARAHGER